MNTAKQLDKLFEAPVYAPKQRCSLKSIVYTAIAGLIALLGVETWALPKKLTSAPLESEASLFMEQATQAIREYREKISVPINPVLDPNKTGLIGYEYSDLTTTEGALNAKRTATNPAFAGVIVKLLHSSGIKKGDLVAINMTGSFPSLNIAVLSACKAMELNPRIISSVGASTYGANIPDFTWLDMEKYLFEHSIFKYRSVAVSLGGIVETGGGLDGKGFEFAYNAIKTHGAPFLEEGDYRSVEKDLLRRKSIFESEGPIKAFISVGGSLTSLGWVSNAANLDTGLLKTVPKTNENQRGLIFRYVEEGIPTIHLLNIARLAERYALPFDPIHLPSSTEMNNTRFLNRYLLLVSSALFWCLGGLAFLFYETRHTNKNTQ